MSPQTLVVAGKGAEAAAVEVGAPNGAVGAGRGGGGKLENLWNKKNPHQLCWLTTHKGW